MIIPKEQSKIQQQIKLLNLGFLLKIIQKLKLKLQNGDIRYFLPMIKMYSYNPSKRISQGDIFKTISKKEYTINNDELIEEIIEFPYIVVMTQDCDLQQDFDSRIQNKKSRNYLQSILICPAYLSTSLRKGNHLENQGFVFDNINKKLWDPIKKNNDSRYHLLNEYEIKDESITIPELVVDFKHYYTMSRGKLYDKLHTNYFVSINTIFREQLSQRFAYYLSRIGLPTVSINESSAYCNNYRFCNSNDSP